MARTIVYTDITFEDDRVARITHVLSDDALTVRVENLRNVVKVRCERDNTPPWSQLRKADL